MDWTTTIFMLLILGGGAFFAYWAIRRTLKEDMAKPARKRRKK